MTTPSLSSKPTMVTPEMIDRAARAIPATSGPYRWDALPPATQDNMRRAAERALRAALEMEDGT